MDKKYIILGVLSAILLFIAYRYLIFGYGNFSEEETTFNIIYIGFPKKTFSKT